MEELKKIAGDINEIKKEKGVSNAKLIAIDKKLEKSACLEKKVTDCVKKIAELEHVKEKGNEREDILRKKDTTEIFRISWK